jgi:DNA (cytosine-5)-methyltransferase 1
MEKGEVPQKYFLSQNAAKGMLRRAERMGRELFLPLRKALEILSKAPS